MGLKNVSCKGSLTGSSHEMRSPPLATRSPLPPRSIRILVAAACSRRIPHGSISAQTPCQCGHLMGFPASPRLAYLGDPALDPSIVIAREDLEVKSCLREMRLAKQKALVQKDLQAEMIRDVQVCQRQIDFETELLAEIIYSEATVEEQEWMPSPWHLKPTLVFKWAVEEGKSADRVQSHRWPCVLTELTCPPPTPSMPSSSWIRKEEWGTRREWRGQGRCVPAHEPVWPCP